jgi:hypothetical protein
VRTVYITITDFGGPSEPIPENFDLATLHDWLMAQIEKRWQERPERKFFTSIGLEVVTEWSHDSAASGLPGKAIICVDGEISDDELIRLMLKHDASQHYRALTMDSSQAPQ